MAKKHFPKSLYVYIDPNSDENDPCLLATEEIDGIDHGELVGIYELKKISKKVVKESLE